MRSLVIISFLFSCHMLRLSFYLTETSNPRSTHILSDISPFLIYLLSLPLPLLHPTIVTLWTVTHQDPLSTEFSRQEYWNGLPFPFPRDLPNPGIEPRSPALQADALPSKPLGDHTIRSQLVSTGLCLCSHKSTRKNFGCNNLNS